MTNIGFWSYGAAALAFFILTVLLLTSWRGRLLGALLLAGASVNAVWALVIMVAYTPLQSSMSFAVINFLEVVRGVVWAVFLVHLMSPGPGWAWLMSRRVVFAVASLVTVAAVLLGFIFARWRLAEVSGLIAQGSLFGHVMLAVLGLVIVEQLYRNTRPRNRWAIKYLCFGVGGLYGYDLFLYSDALLFKRIDPNLWEARGIVNALVVPLMAVSAARNPQWSLDVFVSRHVVFHTTAVMGAGIYLLAMAAGGWYIRAYGGTWGVVAQTAFLFGAAVVLLVLLFSAQFQARLRVFVSKHFFHYKYDYRYEWLRLTRTLAAGESSAAVRGRAVQAIAEIVESSGGALWWRGVAGHYEFAAQRNLPGVPPVVEPGAGSMVRFLADRQWVVDLDEYVNKPEMYEGLELPEWLMELKGAWLVVPLQWRDELLGFVVVERPLAPRSFNWEDSDLLKTAGRQVASHLAQIEAADALADVRQFEAFNRLSAFLIHDLKNVSAQLSLVVGNAAKHKHNPAFVDDAIKTVGHATEKMNRILAQLRSGREGRGNVMQVEMSAVLAEAVSARSGARPVPVLHCEDKGVCVRADRERLCNVIQHLVQNAQEATPVDGRVEVRLRREEGCAVFEVADTGCGMDAAFIRDRLFRPFDSTKGNAGMGIGAYEAREYIRGLGGVLDVESTPGTGTVFRARVPRAGVAQGVESKMG